jgi:2-haloacid dehalogenase
MTPDVAAVKAVVFDTFGTVVDWRTSLIRELTAFGHGRRFNADWAALADQWRGLYRPAMDEVRSGRRPWANLDVLHRESMLTLLPRHGIAGLSDQDIEWLVTIWHRLDPWPDSVSGLRRIKSRYIIAPLSNGSVALLVNMAKRAGLPWDAILGAEVARAYKPSPEAYLRTVALLGLLPHQVMLVAAHNDDLAAAASHGLRTGFVARPTEYGPGQARDLTATGPWDIVAGSIEEVADALGCPQSGP